MKEFDDLMTALDAFDLEAKRNQICCMDVRKTSHLIFAYHMFKLARPPLVLESIPIYGCAAVGCHVIHPGDRMFTKDDESTCYVIPVSK